MCIVRAGFVVLSLPCTVYQVHRARLLDGTEVAMKIQYPGVADSVESDLKNLQRLVQLTNILPPGLYIDEIIEVNTTHFIVFCMKYRWYTSCMIPVCHSGHRCKD